MCSLRDGINWNGREKKKLKQENPANHYSFNPSIKPMTSVARPQQAPSNATFKDKEKPQEVRRANILAARAVSDAIRTSLGPKGMDKMIRTNKGEIIISNDGATILKHMAVLHPAAKMLVDVSHAQDVEAGDGTTTVAILTGALLGAAERLLNKGIHPTLIAESFQRAAQRSVEILLDMASKIKLDDKELLIKAASTSLSSKIVSQHSLLLAPLAVDSVLKVINKEQDNVDLNDIRLVKKLGGTIDDTELINGVVLTQNVVKSAGGPTRIEKAKIGLIQFQLSPPKPDMENNVVVNDYRQMDKILKEERAYLLNICKKIKKAKAKLYGYDHLFKYVDYSKKNAKIAGVEKQINFSRVELEWLDIKFKKESVDRIITNPPTSKNADLNKIYNEFFYQSEYILKKDGTLAIISRIPDFAKKHAEKHNFVLLKERDVWSGEQILKILVFKKKII